MTIAFRHIPSNLRVPGAYFDFDPSQANTQQQQFRTLIIGQALAGTPWAAIGTMGTPQLSLGAADAKTNAGAGSMLALMVAQHKARDSFGELWVLPLVDDPAAVAATGTIALTGPATAPGTFPLYINGTNLPVLVTAGMTATTLAGSIASVANARTDIPVSASAGGATVTFTARNAGQAGNDIDIRLAYRGRLAGEALPVGIGATVTAMSGGSQNPSLALPLLSLSDMPFEVTVCPYTDSGNLDVLKQLMDDNTGRWSWARKLYGHVYCALSATLTGATTFGFSRNDQHVTVLPIWGSPLWPPQVAADYGAAVIESVRIDPAMPLQYLKTNIPPPAPQNRWVLSERNTLLFDGLSSYKVIQGGGFEIERLVTTYQTNEAGVADTSYLDCEVLHTLGFIARDLDVELSTRFARMKLTADNTRIPAGSGLVNPAVIKATLDTRYRALCEVFGVAQDPDGFAKESRVELAGLGRVNVLAPVRVMGQLRIIAVSVNFSKPT